ncbi:hypothetical protein LEP1GSC188_1789 [Leptospira weilii serovar Topaz str. LT2116]|uniref:Uncharacterized protein n=1 Tax=Leptospira weilii serovar Topaz str. LT2116 TaxID=1088540 RepID=M3G1R2_9LEPT|nr:hypothetical protein LEP1GSC188_1789 [Leptospira weilii serovar Topaz str. LT2116]
MIVLDLLTATFGIAFKTRSMGIVTRSSTSTAAFPGNFAINRTCVSAMSEYASFLISIHAQIPKTTVATDAINVASRKRRTPSSNTRIMISSLLFCETV